MKFIAEIDVMPLKALLDPQGKAVNMSMNNLGYKQVHQVRIGKHITLELEADNDAAAKVATDELCKKMLTNPIIEDYNYHIRLE
ncbi:MAG: phosphoribosylformylglycinamidine synthase subunit PurS [Bacteroidia bacterium]|nr:phosphoribosylformylglycinamidine synthase subunit PurS [Bacteroidia bacterium]